MGRVLDLVKWRLSLGREPQDFLGARWIVPFLHSLPADRRRRWALRVLNLSPHYFIDGGNPEFTGLTLDEYLERTFEIITRSRHEIYEKVFRPYLQQDFHVMEYGCGPGFLTRAVAPHVTMIHACDTSTGALACADIINSGDNIRYVTADPSGLAGIESESLDAIISFALVQHLTDADFAVVLDNCRARLKKSGRILFHIQLPDEVWKTEADWKADRSLKGRLKFRYGLHCFGRSLEAHERLFSASGFTVRESMSLGYLNRDPSAPSDSIYLLVAERS